jgi:hypothetical protein
MKYLVHILVLFVILDLGMAVAGYGINYDKLLVEPGTTYYVEEYGDLGLQKTPTLVCRYWTVVGMKPAIFEYGNAGEAKSDCPVMLKVQ